jgi:predicted secreted hydrolase
MITLTQSASIGSALDKQWKTYPYHPPGTSIVFPTDEGSHSEKYKIEWWYANFHLKGQRTGTEYGAMVTFYQMKTDVLDNIEYRLFSISDPTTSTTFTNIQVGNLLASTDHLNLTFQNIFYNDDIQNTNADMYSDMQTASSTADQLNIDTVTLEQIIMENMMLLNTTRSPFTNNSYVNNASSTNEPQSYDHWCTKSNGQNLLPFQYNLTITGYSKQDHQQMQLSIDMDCQKQPLPVGGTGFVKIGKDGFSYYYSLTMLSVVGTLIVNGTRETVSGIAWMDHQWGNFSNPNPPPYSLTVSMEWFSIKLDDNREILTCDTWDIITGKKFNQSFSGMNFVNKQGCLELLKEYKITPIDRWNDTYDHCFFANKWWITEKSKSINLTVIPVYPEQVIRIDGEHPIVEYILSKIFYNTYFWEGDCTVSGKINGQNVHGRAYVELTHNYKYISTQI